jgi:hypothetical protein
MGQIKKNLFAFLLECKRKGEGTIASRRCDRFNEPVTRGEYCTIAAHKKISFQNRPQSPFSLSRYSTL